MRVERLDFFTGRTDVTCEFCGTELGFRLVASEKEWRDFAEGGPRVARHSGPPAVAHWSEDPDLR